MNPSQTLIITQPNGQSYLSKEQQTFNKFIKQIENKKKKLKEFQNLTLLYKQKYITDFEPLRKQYTECRKNFLFLLDQQYSQKVLNKNDRSKLGFLICEMAESLMGTEAHENIKNIYNKYSDIDFDEHIQQEKDFMMSMMEDILDIEFDQDLDLDSPENIMEHVSQKLKEKQEKNQKKSKKTSKQLEKESKYINVTEYILRFFFYQMYVLNFKRKNFD